ncbi:hypothetical protein D3C73_362160 [compost metagenome]
MRALNFNGQKYEAEKIVKYSDSIVGYSAGTEVFAFRGVSDFSLFSISGSYDDPPADSIEGLKLENTQLKLALAEMAETQQKDKQEMQVALAEIADLLTGGTTNG